MNKERTPLINPYYSLFNSLRELEDSEKINLVRKNLIWAYSWAIPNATAVYEIANYSPIIELGAGTGYWAWLLEQASAEVTALDHQPAQPPQWHKIQLGNQMSLAQYPTHTLLLCWPPLNTDMAEQALTYYSGQNLIYIGEWRGRTANEHFFEKLTKDWEIKNRIEIPTWPGFSDQVYILNRS